jgi:hypothetical protein
MIVAVAMNLLNENFGFHPGEIRQLPDLLRIEARQSGAGAEVDGASATCGHHCGLGANQLSQMRTYGVVQFIEHYVVSRRFSHSFV